VSSFVVAGQVYPTSRALPGGDSSGGGRFDIGEGQEQVGSTQWDLTATGPANECLYSES